MSPITFVSSPLVHAAGHSSSAADSWLFTAGGFCQRLLAADLQAARLLPGLVAEATGV